MMNCNAYSPSEFSFEGNMPCMCGEKNDRKNVGIAYIVTVMMILCGYNTVHDCGFSTMITLAGCIQVFANVVLLISVCQRRSVTGVSRKMILLQILVYSFRLSSTTWLRGYLPTDQTGMWLYQACDVAALGCAGGILFCMKKYGTDAQAEQDSMFPLTPTILGCAVLATLIHPDLNDFPLFDTFWTISLYLDVVSLLPQLMMIVRSSDKANSLSVHFIAAMTLSKAIDAMFWWYAFEELQPVSGANIPGFTILGAHLVQLLIMADFIYHYVVSIIFRSKFYRADGTYC